MKQYQPSNESPLNGLLLLTIIGIIGGLILGGVMYAVSKLVYLIILFPVIFGGAGGFIASLAIKKGKIRNPLIAFVMGALMGVFIYGAYNFAEFHFFKEDLYKVVMGDTETAPEFRSLNPDKIMNILLINETGDSDFIGFMKYQAKQGVSINKVGRSSGGIELNETFTWIYMLVELLILAGLAGAMSHTAASEPFCEKCGTWYGGKSFVGSTGDNTSDQLIWALNRDDYNSAGKLLSPVPHDYPRVDLEIQHCPSCKDADLYVQVSQVTKNHKGQINTKKLANGLIATDDYQTMLDSRIRPTEEANTDEESIEIKELRYKDEE